MNMRSPSAGALLEMDEKEVIIERNVPTRFSGIEMLPWLERIAKAATLQNAKAFKRKFNHRLHRFGKWVGVGLWAGDGLSARGRLFLRRYRRRKKNFLGIGFLRTDL